MAAESSRLTTLNELKRRGRRVQGEWQLDARHRLRYRSDDEEELISLEASPVAAEAGALVLAVTEKQERGRSVTSLARLKGTWRANAKNKIEFEVERESGRSDVLTFRGTWKVGRSQELCYTWRRKSPGTKAAVLESLTFTGWWDITEKNRLTYTLEGSRDATFRFRGAVQTPSILAKKGAIRYQLGAEAVGGRQKQCVITLFGKWKLSDKLGLNFEMDYADGRRHAIRFGAEFQAAPDLTVAAQLTSTDGDPLGVELVLTRDFLQHQAHGFLRLKRSLRESAVEAGVSLPW